MASDMTKRNTKGPLVEICDDSGTVVISIEEEYDNGIFLFRVCGSITNEVASDFEDEILAVIPLCNTITIDLEKTEYISGLALRALLNAQRLIDKQNGKTMRLTNCNVGVKDAFKKSGFMEILNIEE